MKLKICGMKYKDNITEVAQLQPDYLGFIFYEKSSRFFEGTIQNLPKSIKKVGVFVDSSLDYILEKIKTHNLQAVQLHGNESPEFCLELKTKCHSKCHTERSRSASEESHHEIPQSLRSFRNDKKEKPVISSAVEIIKVFSIKDNFAFSVLKPYEAVCDYFLFDTKGKLPGGNGYTFNWTILKNYPSTKPFFLSGGIGLDEIDNIMSFLKKQESKYCHAIDINSKFEIEAGLKDLEKLKLFKEGLSFRT